MHKEDSYLRGTRRRRSGLFQGLLAVSDYPGMGSGLCLHDPMPSCQTGSSTHMR